MSLNRAAARRHAREAAKAGRQAERRKRTAAATFDTIPWTALEFQLPESMPDEDGTPVGTWVNQKYVVLVTVPHRQPKGWPPILWLSLRRQDRLPVTDWRDVQRIKDEIAGTGSEGAQLFPAQHRMVDVSNQYALFCIAPGSVFPFGWTERAVSFSEEPPPEARAEAAKRGIDISGARQRPLDDHPEHKPPKKLPVVGPAWEYAGIELEPRARALAVEPEPENIVDVEVAATRPEPVEATPKALKAAVIGLGVDVPASFKSMSKTRLTAWMDKNLTLEQRAHVVATATA